MAGSDDSAGPVPGSAPAWNPRMSEPVTLEVFTDYV